jgi:hypothetical protein
VRRLTFRPSAGRVTPPPSTHRVRHAEGDQRISVVSADDGLVASRILQINNGVCQCLTSASFVVRTMRTRAQNELT